MAIAITVNSKTVFGNKRVHIGRLILSGSVSTGELVTGLASIDFLSLIEVGGTAKAVSHNETLPLASGTATILSESNDATLDWMAIGT